MKNIRNYFKGFTLVELIIVITILVILGSIAFVSFGNYTKNARDSNRLSTMNSIEKGLQLYEIKTSKYPEAEGKITIKANGTTIFYQGVIGETISRNINMTEVPKDPKTSENYLYSVSEDYKRYQLMGFMEGNEYNNLSFIKNTYAEELKRLPKTSGYPLGIILDENNNPITGTGLDIVKTTNKYNIYFSDKDKLSGTGNVLKAGIGGGGLVGYWDFDEGSGNVAYDKSGNGNNGNLSGSILPIRTNGKVGQAMSFINNSGAVTASGGFVDFGILKKFKSLGEGSKHTISGWIYIPTPVIVTSTGVADYTKRQWILNLGSGTNGNHHWIFGAKEINLNPDQVQFGIRGGTQGHFQYKVGEWFFVVITSNGIDLKIYLNGQKQSEVSSKPLKSFNIDVSKFILGKANVTSDRPFEGMIDELRIYDRELSDSEIQNLYNSTK